MRQTLAKLQSGNSLSLPEIDAVFAAMLGGQLSDQDVAAVLNAWRAKGEGTDEIYAGARALRQNAAKVVLPATVRPLIDNCGTGGDGVGSFNLSTAAAIVAASAGARVAKHGNRSVSSRCGSADLLFRTGFPDRLPPDRAAKLLEDSGFTFFFAPNYHPMLKNVAAVRKSLGVRTIFNLLGPLANPLSPEFQLIGVGAKVYLRPIAEALARLGVTKALIVHSRDGMDELSPAAPTDCVLVENGKLSDLVVDPASLGVSGTMADLDGGDADRNFAILTELLDNGKSPTLSAVALNAGAVLWLAGLASSIKDGLALSNDRLKTGATKRFFQSWLAQAKKLEGTHG